jgi:hypothetical protein
MQEMARVLLMRLGQTSLHLSMSLPLRLSQYLATSHQSRMQASGKREIAGINEAPLQAFSTPKTRLVKERGVDWRPREAFSALNLEAWTIPY